VIRLRRKHRWGADRIGFETRLAASTVEAIMNGQESNRSAAITRDRSGELIHVDVKKIAGIPGGALAVPRQRLPR